MDKRKVIMGHVAEWFGIEPDDNGQYDIDDYDWRSGCSMGGGIWLTPSAVVFCIESLFNDLGIDV